MKTYAIVHRRVVEQVVVQAVTKEDGEPKPVASEQTLTVTSHVFPSKTVEWGPALQKELKERGLSETEANRIKAISLKDLSLLTLLLSPRTVTKAAKSVIVSTLEGRALDMAKVLIGEDQAPMQDVLNAVEDLKEWAASQGKKDE